MECADPRACLLRQVAYAVDAAIDVVQVRERDLEGGALFSLTADIVRLTRGSPTRVVVNDRLDVALAAGADGVHLRGDSIGPRAARSLAPRDFLIGRSVHSASEAIDAGEEVDYLVAGTVAATTSKPAHHPLLGFEGLAAIVAAARAPVIAIGGLNAASAAAVSRSGAVGIAGISLFMSASSDSSGCRARVLREMTRAVRATFGIT